MQWISWILLGLIILLFLYSLFVLLEDMLQLKKQRTEYVNKLKEREE